MFKKALPAFILPFLFLLSSSDAGSANPVAQNQKSPDNPPGAEITGILEKMIVENGIATMKLDLNRLTESPLRRKTGAVSFRHSSRFLLFRFGF